MSKSAVIITGGARRVGAAMAVYFAKAGYDIALHYNLSESDARRIQAEICALGVKCKIFSYDLSVMSGIPALMQRIKTALPHCSLLINNASVFERKEFMETDEAFLDQQFAVNFKAPFFLTQAFAQCFVKGSVVNIVDTDISKNQISHFAYLLSKKTLADFTQMAALALGPHVRVNAVSPGSMLPSNQNEMDYEEKIKQLIPMQSHPSLDELSEAVRWLSEQQHITGQLINVDGGKHVL